MLKKYIARAPEVEAWQYNSNYELRDLVWLLDIFPHVSIFDDSLILKASKEDYGLYILSGDYLIKSDNDTYAVMDSDRFEWDYIEV